MYQNITMKTEHLVCLRHHDNQQYTILITPHLMQVVDFNTRTFDTHPSNDAYEHYELWQAGELEAVTLQEECRLEDYVFAQDTLHSWLHTDKEEIAPAKPRGTHFNNFQLTKQLV